MDNGQTGTRGPSVLGPVAVGSRPAHVGAVTRNHLTGAEVASVRQR